MSDDSDDGGGDDSDDGGGDDMSNDWTFDNSFLGFSETDKYKNIKVQRNQLLSEKSKILRLLYFLKLLKIHNIGYSDESKCLFLKVLCYFHIFSILPYVRLRNLKVQKHKSAKKS